MEKMQKLNEETCKQEEILRAKKVYISGLLKEENESRVKEDLLNQIEEKKVLKEKEEMLEKIEKKQLIKL